MFANCPHVGTHVKKLIQILDALLKATGDRKVKKGVRGRPHLLNHGPDKSFMGGGDSVGKKRIGKSARDFPGTTKRR